MYNQYTKLIFLLICNRKKIILYKLVWKYDKEENLMYKKKYIPQDLYSKNKGK